MNLGNRNLVKLFLELTAIYFLRTKIDWLASSKAYSTDFDATGHDGKDVVQTMT